MQKPPQSCICIDVRTVAQNLTKAYDLAMAPSGITVTQFSQLHAIRTLGTPSLNQLAAKTGLDRSTLGRNVRLLGTMGLVEILAGEDGRSKAIHLTKKGLRTYKKAVPLWSEVQQEMTGTLGTKNLSALQEIQSRLTHAPSIDQTVTP